ncbi:MAG: hypothetical protein HOO96_20395 [Polyangiaceae bacterium]|nr:hypothetical protein [Polyangiaceae bacterium]
MRHTSFLALSLALALPLLHCAAPANGADGAEVGEEASEIRADDAWMHLDANTGVNNATLSVVNSGTVRCPNGKSAKTCQVSKLVLPADCNWECQDGLLSRRGEGVLHGRFSGQTFVVDFGFDTYTTGLGTNSVYRLTASSTCAKDPCFKDIVRKKLNSSAAPDAVTAVDFSRAADPNYVLDPMYGQSQLTSAAGLVVSGRMWQGTFRVDRVWRLETPKPACDPLLTARAYATRGGIPKLWELPTEAQAERTVDPEGESVHWLVRTAESPTSVTFTLGFNDLWAERYTVAKNDCALTVIAEH